MGEPESSSRRSIERRVSDRSQRDHPRCDCSPECTRGFSCLAYTRFNPLSPRVLSLTWCLPSGVHRRLRGFRAARISVPRSPYTRLRPGSNRDGDLRSRFRPLFRLGRNDPSLVARYRSLTPLLVLMDAGWIEWSRLALCVLVRFDVFGSIDTDRSVRVVLPFEQAFRSPFVPRG